MRASASIALLALALSSTIICLSCRSHLGEDLTKQIVEEPTRLAAEASAFQALNKRWPTNYAELYSFIGGETNKGSQFPQYEQVDLKELSGGKLQISTVKIEKGATNHVTFTVTTDQNEEKK